MSKSFSNRSGTAVVSPPAKVCEAGGGPAPVFPPEPTLRNGSVYLPAGFRPENGKTGNSLIRLGGHAPVFNADPVADSGAVRLGGHSPIF